MNKKTDLKPIIKHILFIIVLIASAIITALVVALVSSKITNNEETIIISCLIGVWLVITLIMVIRNIYLYNEKVKLIEINIKENTIDKKTKLKIKYVIISVIFSISMGFVLYIQKEPLIYSSNNTEEGNIDISQVLHYRFIILGLLIIAFIAKMIIKKVNRRSKKEETNE